MRATIVGALLLLSALAWAQWDYCPPAACSVVDECPLSCVECAEGVCR